MNTIFEHIKNLDHKIHVVREPNIFQMDLEPIGHLHFETDETGHTAGVFLVIGKNDWKTSTTSETIKEDLLRILEQINHEKQNPNKWGTSGAVILLGMSGPQTRCLRPNKRKWGHKPNEIFHVQTSTQTGFPLLIEGKLSALIKSEAGLVGVETELELYSRQTLLMNEGLVEFYPSIAQVKKELLHVFLTQKLNHNFLGFKKERTHYDAYVTAYEPKGHPDEKSHLKTFIDKKGNLRVHFEIEGRIEGESIPTDWDSLIRAVNCATSFFSRRERGISLVKAVEEVLETHKGLFRIAQKNKEESQEDDIFSDSDSF